MRPATDAERPYGEFVEELEGVGTLFIHRINILSGLFYVGLKAPEISSLMGLRKARERFAEIANGKTFMCLVDKESERNQRFVRFYGFRPDNFEVDGFIRFVRT